MKILMTCQPGIGHFTPLIPLGKELQRRGVQVTIATAPRFKGRIEDAGFSFLPAGMDFDESNLEETIPELLELPDKHRARYLLNEIFLKKAPIAMYNDLVAEVKKYDLIIHNHYELGGPMAAEFHDIPYVSVNVSFVVNREVIKLIQGRQMNELRKQCSLPPDRKYSAVGKYLDIRLMTPEFNFLNAMTSDRYRQSLWAKLIRGGPRLQVLKMFVASYSLSFVKRFVERQRQNSKERFVNNWTDRLDSRDAPLWLQSMPKDRPTIYVSLGTVFNSLYPETFQTILDGVRDLNLNVIVTTGSGVDISKFKPQPTNVYIKKFVPQEFLFPFVDLCINHGGFGSTMGPLSHGIPLISLPLSADQPIIASVVGALGASVPLPHSLECIDAEGAIGSIPCRLTPEYVKELVIEGLSEPSYREAAKRTAEKIAELDTIEDAVEDILALLPQEKATDLHKVVNIETLKSAA